LTDNQAETDRYWAAIAGNVGAASEFDRSAASRAAAAPVPNFVAIYDRDCEYSAARSRTSLCAAPTGKEKPQ